MITNKILQLKLHPLNSNELCCCVNTNYNLFVGCLLAVVELA